MFIGNIDNLGTLKIGFIGNANRHDLKNPFEVISLELITKNGPFDLYSDIPRLFRTSCRGDSFYVSRDECRFPDPNLFVYDSYSKEVKSLDIAYLFSLLHETGHTWYFQSQIELNKDPFLPPDRVHYLSRETTFEDVLETMNQEYTAWEYAFQKFCEFHEDDSLNRSLKNYAIEKVDSYIPKLTGDYVWCGGRREDASFSEYWRYRNILEKIEKYKGLSEKEMNAQLIQTHETWIARFVK